MNFETNLLFVFYFEVIFFHNSNYKKSSDYQFMLFLNNL